MVTVMPCLMSSYDIIDQVDDVEIVVGEPAFTSTPFGFGQTPACGYAETVVITGMPVFTLHNDLDRDFTVVTNDPNDVGIYTVQVVCSI